LSDGVAYMSRNLKPTHMLDMATLTGAQMMNTGMHHAAVLSNDPAFEQVVFQAGQASGDWVFPILYAPELVRLFSAPLLWLTPVTAQQGVRQQGRRHEEQRQGPDERAGVVRRPLH
jgi:hypothetical protein